MIQEKDIRNIINYWHNIIDDKYSCDRDGFNNIFRFTPISYSQNINQYFLDGRPYIDREASEKFVACRFSRKSNISKTIIGFDNDSYCLNIYISAYYLWQNHNNIYGYYWVWLYTMCKNIVQNSSRIPLCKNQCFYNYIKDLLIYLEQSMDNNPSVKIDKDMKYNRNSTKVLPDGLLQTNFYQFDKTQNNIQSQIRKILLIEMIYILNNNDLIISQH